MNKQLNENHLLFLLYTRSISSRKVEELSATRFKLFFTLKEAGLLDSLDDVIYCTDKGDAVLANSLEYFNQQICGGT